MSLVAKVKRVCLECLELLVDLELKAPLGYGDLQVLLVNLVTYLWPLVLRERRDCLVLLVHREGLDWMDCQAEKACLEHLGSKENQLKKASKVIVELMGILVPLEFLVREVLRGCQGSAVPVNPEKREVQADQVFLELLDHLVTKANLDRA